MNLACLYMGLKPMRSDDIKIAIVASEESGQLLASELIEQVNQSVGSPVSLMGVGGDALEKLGLNSLFEPDEIALTGLSDVVMSLPRLLRRISQTARSIIDAKPDCLLLVDSPDFSLRVAKKVKAELPDLPVVKYVAPTVWAWRPERAEKMRAHVDRILAILPFEPAIMESLNGPKTHYVGHKLIGEAGIEQAWKKNAKRKRDQAAPINLLVLPGSRSSEIKSLMEPFRQAVDELVARGNDVAVTIPTLERHRTLVSDLAWEWPVQATIVAGRQAQLEAYLNADAALAASGTVTLELALAGIPAVSCYKVDPLMRLATRMITTWSAALPNLIVDRPIIREFYNEQIRPGMLARCIEQLTTDDLSARRSVMEGYTDVREAMKVAKAPSAHAAEILLAAIGKK